MTTHELSQEHEERLLGELRAALAAVDPVPDDVVAGAQRAYLWHGIDDELAALLADSADDTGGTDRADRGALAGVRGASSRHLVFGASESLFIDVRVDDTVGSISGRVRGASDVSSVSIMTEPGTTGREADVIDEGSFWFETHGRGPFSLLLRVEGRAPVRTPWVLV